MTSKPAPRPRPEILAAAVAKVGPIGGWSHGHSSEQASRCGMSAETLRDAATALRTTANDAYRRGHITLHQARFQRNIADWFDDVAADWPWDDGPVVDWDGSPLKFEESTDARALAAARSALVALEVAA